jgi:hypothetical protein
MRRIYSSYIFVIVLLIVCFSSKEVHGEIVTKTITSYQDEQHRDKDVPKTTEEIITSISVVYTTIIASSSGLTASSPTPTVYGVSNTNPGHQEQTPQQTNIDPNGQSLQESLQDDQQALKRMIMILSLVGGLGVIAVVATIVIFTRMRARNRKQREMDDGNEHGLTSDESLIPSDTDQDDNNNNIVIHSASSLTSLSVNSSDNRHYLEPSAPPALNTEDITNNRRNLVSMSSQTTAPSPSAPTAKELDAMIDDETLTESSSHYHSSSHINTCSRCAPLVIDPPELPPPAYTPSAPPHYVLPPEPIIASPSSSTSLPRRHSMGA